MADSIGLRDIYCLLNDTIATLCLAGVWLVFVWLVFVWCLSVVWLVFLWWLTGIRLVSGKCLLVSDWCVISVMDLVCV